MQICSQDSRCQGNVERCLGNFLPYGTLIVNVLGSLALGWLATVFLDRPEINIALRLGIAVGFFWCIHYIFRFQLRISSTFTERCSLAGCSKCDSQYCSLPGDVLSWHAAGTAELRD